MAVISVTADTFEEVVLKASLPVLVDFYATWCGPCKMLSPLVDAAATELTGKAVVVKIDVDECSAIAAKYNVSAIPTLVVIKGGECVKTSVGYISKDEILAMVASVL